MTNAKILWGGGIALFLVVLLVICSNVVRPREPSYGGKPLSFWLTQYFHNKLSYTGDTERATLREEAKNAIKAMGTNSIPTLLKMIRTSDFRITNYLYNQLLKSPFRKILFSIHYRPAEYYNQNGAIGFEVLGEEAKVAVPDLTRIFEQNISMTSQQCAANALGAIGESAKGALPSLLRALTNANSGVRFNAIRGLSQIHGDPDASVPALMRAVNDPSSFNRAMAIDGLGEYGPEASRALPLLFSLTTNTDISLRPRAVWSIGQIHSSPETSVPLLISFLEDVNLRDVAANGLVNFKGEAQIAIPALTRMLNAPNNASRTAAEQALAQISPTNQFGAVETNGALIRDNSLHAP